ncbi:MAG: chitobiase/beta-hexosaminidase C-terminal domain-containing protein, partial [Gemmatimonadota bacterium]
RRSRPMKILAFLALLALPLLLARCARPPVPGPVAGIRPAEPGQVVGIHLLSWTSDSLLVELGKTLPALAEAGINLVILEVDYSFDFQSHPELRQGGQYITRDGARRFAALCRRHGIRLVPQFQSLGHQSWAKHTYPLLTRYPELDITPGAFPENEGIYCREWDPTNPRVNQIVLPLIDEIVDAFQADAIHVGMDEIFLLGHEQSPTTRGQDPAALFARVVNEFHRHFVEAKGLEMFMWGDRLIDGRVCPCGEWESSMNGTAPAIDMIPNDIVICDWHYEPMAAYCSVPMFMEKGFRVLPSSWRNVQGAQALVKYSYGLQHPKLMGHLFTTWGRVEPERLRTYPPMLAGIQTIRSGRFFDVAFELRSVSAAGVLEVALAAPDGDLAVHYTADGSEPTAQSTLYTGPVRLDRSATLRAIACRGDAVVSDVTDKQFVVHKATGRPVYLTPPPSPKYPPRDGAAALVNGVTGSDSYADGQWVGAEGPDLVAVVDLGAGTQVSSVAVNSMNNRGSWVHHSPLVEVFGSPDGQAFTRLGEVADTTSEDHIVRLGVTFPAAAARYLKVHIHNQIIPEGSSGAGSPAWLFVDEIVVE